MSTLNGRYVWYDLMTPNVEAARAFYTEVIGWKTTKWEHADYFMWNAGEDTVGGVMALPEAAQKAGAPPHWVAYIGTDDVDATAKKAEQLGGRVLVKGTDIPTVGRFAVLADPQGATFAVFKPLEEMPPQERHKPGRFSWAELNTTDYEGAWKFYSALLGWKPTMSMDMGPSLGQYFMFGLTSDKSMGGMSNVALQMKMPPHWLHYVTVSDLDATLQRIKDKGGKVLNGPMDVPGGDRIAQCMDPQGGMFAVYSAGK